MEKQNPTQEIIWVVMKYTKDGDGFPLRAYRNEVEAYKNLACLKETAALQKSKEQYSVFHINLWTIY